MLTIRHDLYESIVAHTRADHPIEACGILAGPAGSDRPERHVPMANAERSRLYYRFDAAEQLAAWRDMDDRGEDVVVVYHSHTATEAYPSRTDVAHACESGAHYVLVSTRDADGLGDFQFRSFRIVNGEVAEERVAIVPAAASPAGLDGGSMLVA